MGRFFCSLSLKALCLPLHVFYDNIVYLPKRCAVIQHFARLVCVKMDFDQLFVTNG